MLSRQQAGMAAAGVASSSQSAVASANALVSDANTDRVRSRTRGTLYRPRTGLGGISGNIFNALGDFKLPSPQEPPLPETPMRGEN